MKMTAIILLTACLQVSAEGYSQKVTLVAKDVTLEKVFIEIKKQTGYNFLYDENAIRNAKMVTIAVHNTSIQRVLEICFANQSLEYKIVEKTILVKAKNIQVKKPKEREIAIPVTGRITDASGNPLARASVTLKGMKTAVVSDNVGYFTINAAIGQTLVISYVGFETREVKIMNPSMGLIALTPSTQHLDETVVIAYGTTTRRYNTGNVSNVRAEDIERQPVANPLQALHGRMPGVHIVQQTGVPGGGFKIQIRGQNSIRDDGNNPLFIIDGVPFPSASLSTGLGGLMVQDVSPLNAINPADIESIEVLKDADATAIYGSRGANGVVLITTKKGKIGETNLSINAYHGAGRVMSRMELLNSEQYMQMRREAFANDGAVAQPWDFDMNGAWDTTRYTDWQKVLIGGTARQTSVNAGVSGGSANTQFLLRGGYYRESTVYPGDFAYRKGSGHANLSHRSSNQKFRAELTITYVVEDNRLFDRDLTNMAISLPPVAPALYDSMGSINWANSTWENPIARLRRTYRNNTNSFIGNGTLTYHVTPALSVRLSAGYTAMAMKELAANPLSAYDPASGRTSTTSNFGNGSVNTWIVEPQLMYQGAIGKGKLEILVGSTFQQNIFEKQRISARGITSDAMLENLQAATSYSAFFENSQYKYSALFGRVHYNVQDKYFVNLTGRRDGSSRFGPGRRFGNFGAAGLAWLFSNEEFLNKRLPFLSYGKLRVSYGSTGNDQIPDYGYLDTYASTQYPYNGVAGILPVRLVNPDFAWEVNRKLETALEAAFFNNRIFLTASWYRNRSSNQLVGYALPVITGQPTVQYNLPAVVQNTGWEFELSTTNMHGRYFKWTTAMNFTIPQNKLVRYPNLEGSPYANRYVVGKPLNIAKVYQYNGVDPVTGVYTFEDVNKDGSISSPVDRQTVKVIGPVLFGGVRNAVKFKSWELNFFIQFVKQTARNYINNSFFSWPGARNNQPVWVWDRWQHLGENASIQRFSAVYGTDASLTYYNNLPYSELVVSDASFVRLKNVSLSYSLPFDSHSIRIYLQGQNLLTFTNYMGMDPESGSASLPPLRMITAGFQFSL